MDFYTIQNIAQEEYEAYINKEKDLEEARKEILVEEKGWESKVVCLDTSNVEDMECSLHFDRDDMFIPDNAVALIYSAERGLMERNFDIIFDTDTAEDVRKTLRTYMEL